MSFPYQFMAGGAVTFTVYVKLNILFAELRILNKEPKIAHASGVSSDASCPVPSGAARAWHILRTCLVRSWGQCGYSPEVAKGREAANFFNLDRLTLWWILSPSHVWLSIAKKNARLFPPPRSWAQLYVRSKI